MRTPLIAGNWKMNLLRDEARSLSEAIAATAKEADGVEVLLCPPFPLLDTVRRTIDAGPVALGAQNVHNEPSGAFTGEVSAAMLADTGCEYVIVGHSERRQYFGETDATVRHKANAALEAGLTPIICVGETLDEREDGSTPKVVERQISGALERLKPEDVRRIVIAYEPVWAIGTGKTATPETAQEVHALIRGWLKREYGGAIADTIRILYGGSMKPANAEELLAERDIDGGLVGGASLKADDFSAIIRAAL
ncbi:MAG: Triosephosphate isomerase [Calditrichaeota bacterium]|nr:Triosephosphate isomerase [Calditrichota bacterium]